jgi:hypothetical protein
VLSDTLSPNFTHIFKERYKGILLQLKVGILAAIAALMATGNER